jgi:hypothetical protein
MHYAETLKALARALPGEPGDKAVALYDERFCTDVGVLSGGRPKPRSATPTSSSSAPNNVEAEQALLGAILVNNDAYYRVSDFLKPSHFYEATPQASSRWRAS